MSGKIIFSVVSLILVVSVAAVDPVIQPSQKIIGVICNNAGGDDQKFCEETLQSVTGLDAANPKAYIVTLVKATADSITKAVNMSDRIISRHKNHNIVGSLGCYKNTLNESMSSIKLCMDLVQNNNIQQIVNQSEDFKSWLSAAYSYVSATMCLDDSVTVNESKIFERVESQTLYFVKKFISMCLNIATGLPQIVEELMPLI